MPLLRYDVRAVSAIFMGNTISRLTMQRKKEKRASAASGQFRSPGQGMRGKGYGHYGGQQGYGGYSRAGYHSQLSEGGEGYSMGGDDSYGYGQMASDDSRDTQFSQGDMALQQQQQHAGFGGFGEGVEGQQGESQGDPYSQDQKQHQQQSSNDPNSGEPGKSPPDIKYEITPMPFIKPDDFELIEIDPDEEDDI